MSLLESIKNDQRNARIVRDALKATVLTTLIGEIEVELTRLKPEQRVSEKINSVTIAKVKQFLDKIEETVQLAGDDLPYDKFLSLGAEREVLIQYMPVQFNADQITSVLIAHFGCAVRAENKGTLMKFLKDNHPGQYDGKVAASVVDSLLKL